MPWLAPEGDHVASPPALANRWRRHERVPLQMSDDKKSLQRFPSGIPGFDTVTLARVLSDASHPAPPP